MFKISVVLCRPENPANIGSIARVMNNFSFNKLILVNPCDFLSHGESSSFALAMHSHEILKSAKICDSIESALGDFHFAIAFSGKNESKNIDNFVLHDIYYKLNQHSINANIALVFGNESTGLLQSEINLCHSICYIPSSENQPSLNLSHAVGIVLYELSKYNLQQLSKLNINSLEYDSANIESTEKIKNNIIYLMEKCGFINTNIEKKLNSVSNFISRKKITQCEANYILGVLNKIISKINLIK